MTVVFGLIGLAMLLGYLGFLLWWIKAVPLIVICAIVVALVVYDFVQTVREGSDAL
jgi:hypothetical protein